MGLNITSDTKKCPVLKNISDPKYVLPWGLKYISDPKYVLPRGLKNTSDTSGSRRRPLVRLLWQRHVLNTIHSLAHLVGIRATRRLLAACFVWKGIAANVGQWCRECAACQKVKITTQPTGPVQPIPVPSSRFTHVHADLVGPLPVSSVGHSHMMTIIDRLTRWVEVLLLSSTMAGWLDYPFWCAGLHHH